jgi:hypothetical protein
MIPDKFRFELCLYSVRLQITVGHTRDDAVANVGQLSPMKMPRKGTSLLELRIRDGQVL